MIICIILFSIFNSIILFIYKNNPKKYKKLSFFNSFLLRILIHILGIKLSITDASGKDIQHNQKLKYFQKNKNYLIVSNHLGYLDIVLLQSILKNNCFISHHEMKKQSSLLYFIAQLSGSYFIERRTLKNIRQELRDIAKLLKAGVNLTFFPEGTSTDGSSILPFHVPFFSTAGLADKDILPICINYTHINHEPMSVKNRDRICWYTENNISFKQHLFSFLKLKSVKVNITFCEPIKSKGKNSRALAEESHKTIKALFQPPLAE